MRIVQPLFYVRKGSELKIQAVWAKTCRGAMTRFIIENRIDNKIMQHNILKHGFTYCGIIYLLSGDERLAYQKVVNR